MDLQHLCMGCMTLKGDVDVCPSCGFVEGTPPETPQHLAPRTIVNDRYLLGRVLGQGGFGITYLGWDMNLDIKLAVKEYLPRDFATRTAEQTQVSVYSGDYKEHFQYGLEKFLEEAKILAQYNNEPGIVSVRDFFRENGTAYLVMYYLEGITFKQYLEQMGGKIPFESAQAIMMPVLDALKEVHRNGLLHRDISPDNIYITTQRQVKLLDFGAARHSVTEHSKSLSVILKPGYAPEEQYRTKGKQGPWTDLYAAAATLYRAIAGQVPPDSLDRMDEDTLEPPSKLGIEIPAYAEAALMKALALRAPQRFQTIQEFQSALAGSDAGSPSGAVPSYVPHASAGANAGATQQAQQDAGVTVPMPRDAQAAQQPPRDPNATVHVPHQAPPAQGASAYAAGQPQPHSQGANAYAAGQQPQGNGWSQQGMQQGQGPYAGMPLQQQGQPMHGYPPYAQQPKSSNAVIWIVLSSVLGVVLLGVAAFFLLFNGGSKKMPDLVGLTASEARSILYDQSITFKDEEKFSDTVEKGKIVEQSPGKDAKLEKGQLVTIYISKGKEQPVSGKSLTPSEEQPADNGGQQTDPVQPDPVQPDEPENQIDPNSQLGFYFPSMDGELTGFPLSFYQRADMNGDGIKDLVLAYSFEEKSQVSVFTWNGSAMQFLTNYEIPGQIFDIVPSKANTGGEVMNVLGDNAIYELYIDQNQQPISNKVELGYQPLGIAVGHLDTDGKDDLAILHQLEDGTNQLIYNVTGTPTQEVLNLGNDAYNMYLADLDGNGISELLYWYEGKAHILVWEETNFKELASITFGEGKLNYYFTDDLNGDGTYEVVTVNEVDGVLAGNVWEWQADKNDLFVTKTFDLSGSSALAAPLTGDFDGDGSKDIMILDGQTQENTHYTIYHDGALQQ